MPALLKSRSTRPWRVVVTSKRLRTDSSSVTSVGTGSSERSGWARRQLLQARTPPAGEHHCPAVAAERRCDRRANATPCSGNHCDLVPSLPQSLPTCQTLKGL